MLSIFSKINSAYISFLVILICLIFFPFNGLSNELYTIVNVGYKDNSSLVNDLKSNDHKGYGYDVLKKIESFTNLKFKFVNFETSLTRALEENKIDLTGLFFETKYNKDSFIFISTPLDEQYISLATKGNQNIYYNDPKSIDGKTVATYFNNPATEILENYLIQNNISVQFKTTSIEQYLNQEADFYLISSKNPKFENYQTVLNLDILDTYLIVDNNNVELAEKINKSIKEILFTDGTFFNELKQKYFSNINLLTHRGLTRQESEKLKGKTFKVGFINNYPPLSYTEFNDKPLGVTIDFMNELANTYGFNVDYSPYNIENINNLNTFDILISNIGTNSHAYSLFQVTEPYKVTELGFITKKQFIKSDLDFKTNSLAIKSIGILNYLHIDYNEILRDFPNAEIVFYSNLDDLAASYHNNEVNSILFDIENEDYIKNLINIKDEYLYQTNYKIYLRFEIANDLANEFIPIFNIIFNNYDIQHYNELLNLHSAKFIKGTSVFDFIKSYWYLIATPIFMFGIIFLCYYIFQQSKLKKQFTDIINIDSETNFISYHRFKELSAKFLENAGPYEYDLITFDIDSFKTINTYYGTQVGSEVLKKIATTLNLILNPNNTIFCRTYADNFIILKKKKESIDIKTIIEKNILPKIDITLDDNFYLSISVGIYEVDNTEEKLNIMLDRANLARNQGKSKRETTYYTFDKNLKNTYETRLKITFNMKNALKNNEFFLVYQPKINFESLTVSGAEALVRWKNSNNETVFPSDFINEFEQNGFISKLDLYVFEKVCQFIKTNAPQINIPIIAVNLSGITLLEENIVKQLRELINKYQLSPTQFELEITESALIYEEKKIITKVKQLRKQGFSIAVDDFGSGVSSLNRLASIESDVLKLDKSFLDNNSLESNNSIVVKKIVELAKALNLQIVAEGIETFSQAMWLKSIGCDYAQGYYYAKPMPETEFLNLLQEITTFN